MEKLNTAFTAALSAAVDKKLKDSNYVPPEGDTEPMDGVTAAFAKLNPNIKLAD